VTTVFLILPIVLPAILLREFARQVALAHLETKTALLIDVAVAVIQIATVVILGNNGSLSTISAFFAIGTACGIPFVGWMVAWRRHFAIELIWFTADFLQNWRFGKWVLAGAIANSSIYFILPWLITFHHDTAAAGLFAASSTMSGLANTLVLGLANILIPQAAKAYAAGGRTQLRQVLSQFSLLFGATVGPFALFLIAFGGPVADLLYDGRYPGAGPIIAMLALGLLVGCLGIVTGGGLYALHRPLASFWAEVVQMIVTLTLASWLVPSNGAAGAAFAMLVGLCLGTAVNCAVFLKIFAREVPNHEQEHLDRPDH
jgi:O-antigen/teichoic acid export membrane protein